MAKVWEEQAVRTLDTLALSQEDRERKNPFSEGVESKGQGLLWIELRLSNKVVSPHMTGAGEAGEGQIERGRQYRGKTKLWKKLDSRAAWEASDG